MSRCGSSLSLLRGGKSARSVTMWDRRPPHLRCRSGISEEGALRARSWRFCLGSSVAFAMLNWGSMPGGFKVE